MGCSGSKAIDISKTAGVDVDLNVDEPSVNALAENGAAAVKATKQVSVAVSQDLDVKVEESIVKETGERTPSPVAVQPVVEVPEPQVEEAVPEIVQETETEVVVTETVEVTQAAETEAEPEQTPAENEPQEAAEEQAAEEPAAEE